MTIVYQPLGHSSLTEDPTLPLHRPGSHGHPSQRPVVSVLGLPCHQRPLLCSTSNSESSGSALSVFEPLSSWFARSRHPDTPTPGWNGSQTHRLAPHLSRPLTSLTPAPLLLRPAKEWGLHRPVWGAARSVSVELPELGLQVFSPFCPPAASTVSPPADEIKPARQ